MQQIITNGVISRTDLISLKKTVMTKVRWIGILLLIIGYFIIHFLNGGYYGFIAGLFLGLGIVLIIRGKLEFRNRK